MFIIFLTILNINIINEHKIVGAEKCWEYIFISNINVIVLYDMLAKCFHIYSLCYLRLSYSSNICLITYLLFSIYFLICSLCSLCFELTVCIDYLDVHEIALGRVPMQSMPSSSHGWITRHRRPYCPRPSGANSCDTSWVRFVYEATCAT